MDINKELSKYEKFIDFEKLIKYSEVPISLIPDEIRGIIPSYEMGADGPYLRSVFIVSKAYLCEIRTTEYDFDLLKLHTIFNYRVKVSTINVNNADETITTHTIFEVIFAHFGDMNFKSALRYIGDDSKQWLDKVFELIPVSVMG